MITGTDLGAMYSRIEADTSGLKKADASIKKFAKNAAASIAGIFAAGAFGKFVKDATFAAARYETLGVVMNQVGRNAGYSADEMAKYEKIVRKSGISMIKTREIVTRMTQAQIDLTKSSKLARIAQDAAVIGNLDSSESFGRLIHGIQSAQVVVLRNIGINVNFMQSYKRLAAQIGKNVNELTEQEKMQARLNAVLEQGERIHGVYAASMDTPMKKFKSLKRYVNDAKVVLGKIFTPAFGVIIDEITAKFKNFFANIDESKIATWGASLKSATENVLKLAGGIRSLNDIIGGPNAQQIAALGIGYKLFGGQATIAATGVMALSNAMDKANQSFKGFGLENIKLPSFSALKEDLNETAQAAGDFFTSIKDVFSGKRDWNTGELLGLHAVVDANLKEVLEENYVDPWITAGKEVSAAQERAAADNKINLQQIEIDYKKHADEIARIADQIAMNQQSGAELLRSMERSGMSDIDAWRDLKKEAQEYEKAARDAIEAGDFAKAIESADKAQGLYEDLNQEVRQGQDVLISQKKGLAEAITGVKKMIALRDEALKSQQQIQIDAANALAAQAGPDSMLATFENIKKEADILREETIVKLGDKYINVWTEGESAATEGIKSIKEQILDLYNAIDRAADRLEDMGDVHISGKQFGGAIGRKTGGMIGWARAQAGRFFSGYGGGDKIPILGEAGEFMLRKEAVRDGGIDAARAFNQGNWSKLIGIVSEKLSFGGPVAWPQVALAGGGAVPGYSNIDSGQATETPRVYNIHGESGPIKVKADERNAERLLAALERRHGRRI